MPDQPRGSISSLLAPPSSLGGSLVSTDELRQNARDNPQPKEKKGKKGWDAVCFVLLLPFRLPRYLLDKVNDSIDERWEGAKSDWKNDFGGFVGTAIIRFFQQTLNLLFKPTKLTKDYPKASGLIRLLNIALWFAIGLAFPPLFLKFGITLPILFTVGSAGTLSAAQVTWGIIGGAAAVTDQAALWAGDRFCTTTPAVNFAVDDMRPGKSAYGATEDAESSGMNPYVVLPSNGEREQIDPKGTGLSDAPAANPPSMLSPDSPVTNPPASPAAADADQLPPPPPPPKPGNRGQIAPW